MLKSEYLLCIFHCWILDCFTFLESLNAFNKSKLILASVGATITNTAESVEFTNPNNCWNGGFCGSSSEILETTVIAHVRNSNQSNVLVNVLVMTIVMNLFMINQSIFLWSGIDSQWSGSLHVHGDHGYHVSLFSRYVCCKGEMSILFIKVNQIRTCES